MRMATEDAKERKPGSGLRVPALAVFVYAVFYGVILLQAGLPASLFGRRLT
jgi:hypothetical protein